VGEFISGFRVRHKPAPSSDEGASCSPSNWQSVFDGQQCIGHLISRGKIGVEAFDRDDKSLAIFRWLTDAIGALSDGNGDD